MPLATIEVFRTTINSKRSAAKILKTLHALFPTSKITIDLNDCDRVLRIEGVVFDIQKAMKLVKELGYTCEFME